MSIPEPLLPYPPHIFRLCKNECTPRRRIGTSTIDRVLDRSEAMAVPTPRHVYRRHRHELLFLLFLLQRFHQFQPQFVPSNSLLRDGLQRHPSRVKRFQKRDLFERRVKQFSRLESLSEFLKRRHDALLSFFVRHHHPATLRELLATFGKTTTKKSVSISLPLGYIDVYVDDRGT